MTYSCLRLSTKGALTIMKLISRNNTNRDYHVKTYTPHAANLLISCIDRLKKYLYVIRIIETHSKISYMHMCRFDLIFQPFLLKTVNKLNEGTNA